MKIKKRFFFLSTLLSLGLHAILFYLLQFSGLYNFRGEKEISKQEEMDYLKTVFSKTTVQKNLLFDANALPVVSATAKLEDKNEFEKPKKLLEKPTKIEKNLADQKELEKLFIKEKSLPKSKLSVEKKIKTQLNPSMKKVSIKPVKRGYPLANPKEIEGLGALKETEIKPELKEKSAYAFSSIKPVDTPARLIESPSILPTKGKLDFKRKKTGFSPLFKKVTKSCADDFDIDVQFMPKEGEEGYLFSVTLIPKPSSTFPKLKQNFFFLIDRSNAIGKKRFHVTQTAILKALSNLSEEDTFNILAFDNRIELFSPYNLHFNKEGIARAKHFMDDLSLGNIFSSANVTRPLYSVLSYPAHEDQINVAVLLTNGDGIDSVFRNRRVVDEWTLENRGRVSLFSVVLDSDIENLKMKMFSSANTGKMITSSTTRGIKRKLQRLIKTIKHPIAKDVHISAMSLDGEKAIELSAAMRPPHMYLDDPYVIIGEVDSLEDFYLFVQAKQNDHILNIKKKICFNRANEAHKSLKKEWSIQKAFEQYQLFLHYNDPRYLQTMRNLLLPYNLEIAF